MTITKFILISFHFEAKSGHFQNVKVNTKK